MHFESDASIRDTLGQQARDDNFPAEDLTSDHDHYVHHDYDPDVPDLTVQMTPEAYDPPLLVLRFRHPYERTRCFSFMGF